FDEEYSVLFFNENSYSRLQAVQGFAEYTHPDGKLKVELSGQFNWGNEEIANVEIIKRYRSMPDFMARANVHMYLPNDFYVSLFAQIFGGYSWSIQTVNDSLYINDSEGYMNLDAVAGKHITDRLSVYVKGTNLLSPIKASPNMTFFPKGIASNVVSGHQYEYMPQQKTMIHAGLSFDLNRRAEENDRRKRKSGSE
ncbi:MAG: hypothetical protein AAF570_13510, partial [Bacteroidota bacterium]